MIDFHMHSKTSSDSEMEVPLMIKEAEKKGLKHICITNHHEPSEVLVSDYSQSLTDESIEQYRNEIRNYKGSVDVSFGIEMSYIPDRMDYISSFLEKYDFDYVLGSIHYVEGKKVADRAFKGMFSENMVSEYFERLKEAIKTKKFDAISHMDIFRRVTDEPDFELVKKDWEEVATLLIKHNVGFEINTSRSKEVADDFYPTKNVIELLVNSGVKLITVGSDAHDYVRIGSLIPDAIKLLKSLGVNEIYYFKNRKPIAFEI